MSVAYPIIDVEEMAGLMRQVMVDFPSGKAITESSRFVEDLGMDSINRLMLVTLLEDVFHIQLESHMGKLAEMHTVGEVVVFLRGLKGGA